MVQEIRIVYIKVEQEIICALLKGYAADGLRWPLTSQNQPMDDKPLVTSRDHFKFLVPLKYLWNCQS